LDKDTPAKLGGKSPEGWDGGAAERFAAEEEDGLAQENGLSMGMD
jgi:hypothetical protein